jgi:ABC-type sugar transport system, periplasmic component
MKFGWKMTGIAIMIIVLLAAAAGCGSGNSAQENDQSGSPNSENTGQNRQPADNSAAEPETIELEFWTINLKKNFEAYITENLIAAYEAEHPNIKIKWVDVPGAEVTKKFITALSTDDVPDVVNETTGGISVLQRYGALLPLSDILPPEDFEPYFEGLVESVTYGGKVMALPWYTAGPHVQFINAELYEKAGLDPNQPSTTFDELFEKGRIIHEKLKTVYGSNDIPTIELMISEGLPIVNEDRTEAVFNSPEHAAFVEKFVQAYKTGAIAPGAVGKDDRQLQQTLDNELTAHVGQSTSTAINSWAKNNPSLLEKIKVYPAVTGKADKVAIKDFQTFVVPKKSKYPKEAAEFAKFVTSAQKQLEFCKLVAIFPSTKKTLEDAHFTDFEVTDLFTAARRVQVDTAHKMTLGTFGFNNEQTMKDYYNEQIRAALLGEKTSQQALDDAKAFWDQELKKQ